MALKTFVIVSGINNLSDARYCSGMEVNELGFNIEPDHENFTDPNKFKEMTDWLSGVEFVGEILSEQTDLTATISAYGLQAVQISQLTHLETAMASGLRVIFSAQSMADASDAWEKSNHTLAYIILNGFTPSSAETFPFVIGEGFDANDVLETIEKLQPKGISLKGGDEIRPGYKDFDELADILEVLEIDDMSV